MYFSSMGTAILAGFAAVGAAPAAHPHGAPIGEPVISPVISPVAVAHDEATVATAKPIVNMTQTPPTLTYLFSAVLELGPAQRPIVSAAGIREGEAYQSTRKKKVPLTLASSSPSSDRSPRGACFERYGVYWHCNAYAHKEWQHCDRGQHHFRRDRRQLHGVCNSNRCGAQQSSELLPCQSAVLYFLFSSTPLNSLFPLIRNEGSMLITAHRHSKLAVHTPT